MRLRSVGLLLPSLSLLIGCGSTLQLNRSYRPQYDGNPKIAVFPILTDASGLSDEGFTSAFEKSKARCTLVPIKPLRERLAGDDRAKGHLLAVAQRAYAEDDLARAPRIQDVIGANGLADLRVAFDSADVLLFPVSLRMGESLGSTAGELVYRLYDLRDGSVVFQNKAALTVNLSGEKARIVLFFLLTGRAQGDVEKVLLAGHGSSP